MIFNGDFELMDVCPKNYQTQSYKPIAPGWKSTDGGTPDYFHQCSKEAGVPYSWMGKNKSQSGRAYVGIYTYGSEYREFIEHQFLDSLTAGQQYIFQFYYKLAKNSHICTDRIMAKIYYSSGESLYIPFVKDSSLDYQTGQWELAIDTIMATGTEMKLVIGNFDDDYKTKATTLRSREEIYPKIVLYKSDVELYMGKAYYLIDNVSLTPIQELPERYIPEEKYIFANIQFAFNSADLVEGTLDEIIELAEYLKETGKEVSIIGHTDEMGSKAYNQSLSERRAEAVTNFLIGLGVSSDKVYSDGRGETEPLFFGETEEDRAANRRVEFIIY